MRTRVKICGITRIEDALAAAQAGADAIGLVFYSASPRCVQLPQAQAICRVLPPFVSVVALFVNAARDEVERVLEAVPVDLLQFHGSEAAHPRASGFLLDAWQPATHGGGGAVFDWKLVPAGCDRPLVLAGGLTADNVAAAIEQIQPFAVDVSSGVEERKGIKSEAMIQAFMRGVERGDASRARS
jgi:phosphoribosylanthranilate isomerase